MLSSQSSLPDVERLQVLHEVVRETRLPDRLVPLQRRAAEGPVLAVARTGLRRSGERPRISRGPTAPTPTQKKNCYAGGLFLVYLTFVCLMLILRDFFYVVIVLA